MPKPFLLVRSSVRIETQQHLPVLQWILLLHDATLRDGTALDWPQHALDFGAVDELGDVRLCDKVRRKQEVALELARLGCGSVDGVERREGGRGPDHEAAEVATRCELEKVERVDGAGFDTRDVAEGAHKVLAVFLPIVDDERAAALLVASVPHLALAGTQLARSLHLLHIWTSADGFEECNGGGRLPDGGVAECGRGDDEWYFWNGRDVVATREKERSRGGSSDGGGRREALLAEIDLLVPFAPDFGWSEHAAGATLVTEGGLAGAVSTTAGDTWDTGDGAAWTISVLSATIKLLSSNALAPVPFPLL